MKEIILLLIILSIKISLTAQQKGDNIIVIQTEFSADSNFIKISKHLASKGYYFESRDNEIGQIVTSPKPYAGGYHYKLIINCIEKEIKIRASAELMTLTQQVVWTDWHYENPGFLGGNLFNKAFQKFYPDIETKNISFINEY